MKNLLFLSILCLIASCTGDNIDKATQIKRYYEGFNNSDFNQIKGTIADSLIITEGDYVMEFDKQSYYGQFKWDSVFQPTYKVISIQYQNGEFIANVAVESLRFEFLQNNPLTCEHRFSFIADKISKIDNLDCKETNWEVWQKERDSLVNWIKENHSELDGFVHDLSMKGAQNYLKAIELYRNKSDD